MLRHLLYSYSEDGGYTGSVNIGVDFKIFMVSNWFSLQNAGHSAGALLHLIMCVSIPFSRSHSSKNGSDYVIK